MVRDLLISDPNDPQLPKEAGWRPPEKGDTNVSDLVQDIRIGLRSLVRRPLYSGVAVLTLGLGIGATTAMMSVANTVLLPDLSYQEPERLVTLWQEWPGYRGLGKHINLTDDQYRLWRDEATALSEVAMFNASEWGYGTLTELGRPSRVGVGSATASIADVIGMRPQLGRWFRDWEEGTSPGEAAPVAVISHKLWQRAFGGEPDTLGSTLVLDGLGRTIIGILPLGFELRWLGESPLQSRELAAKDIWVPYGQTWDCVGCGSSMYQGLGRLVDGATISEAEAEAERILAGSMSTDTIKVRMVPRDQDEIRGLASPLLLLLAGAGLLLLIACGNIATLSVGEMQSRSREMATRIALGAGRFRISRLFLIESVILGLIGAAVGIVFAVGGIESLKILAPPIPRIDEVTIDHRLLAIAAGLGTLAGLIFGTIPSLSLARSSATEAMSTSSRTQTGRSSRFHFAVIAAEIALSVVLLVTGGLLIRSLSLLLSVDPGFDTEKMATAHLSLPDDRYDTPELQTQFLREVVQRMDQIPGAKAVTAANGLPFPGRTSGWSVWLEDQPSTEDRISTKLFHVAPGYHETMGIQLISGRAFTEGDGPESQRVALVGESLAQALWPDTQPVGAQLHYPWGTVTVVGVVADVKREALAGISEKTFYVPFAQHSNGSLAFAVRTSNDPRLLIPRMRKAVWDVDDTVAITEIDTMTALVNRSVSDQRFRTLLIAAFGLSAVLLASVGIFGVAARMVGMRRRELAIRMAVGAGGADLIRMVVRQNLKAALVGTALGVAGAIWVSRFVSRFLHGVGTTDILTYATVCVFTLALTLVASYIPARRCATVNPVDVLRAD